MAEIILACGPQPADVEALFASAARVERLSAVPTRQELKVLDRLAAEILPVDPTMSLDEIAAQPDVSHLGTPGPAPQAPHLREALRVIVCGSDAALSAVLTRMMRGDYLWAEVGFVASSAAGAGASVAATNWDLPADPAAAFALAREGTVSPVPLIRNDSGQAVAGAAAICQWSDAQYTGEITGEIIVDNAVIVRQDAEAGAGAGAGGGAEFRRGGKGAGGGAWGARLVPMLDAPGILAAAAVGPLYGTPEPPRGWKKLFARSPEPGRLDESTMRTGRAVQAGGPSLRIIIDGVSAKRARKRVAFYRHLRDLQVVRP